MSERIRLRPFRLDDAAAVAESCRDSAIPRFTMMPDAMTEDQARDWIARGMEWWPRGVARFAITVPPSDRCVGQIGVRFQFDQRRAEGFYWLDRRSRGQGLTSEALALVSAWVFGEHDIVRVQLLTHVGNAASHRVARRCGFEREGILRAWEPVKDEQPDMVMWSRSATDPPVLPAAQDPIIEVADWGRPRNGQIG